MADQLDIYNAVAKFTGVFIMPETLTVVGVDCPDSECPELADPDRIGMPIDEELVVSLMTHGNRQAIKIRKFGKDKRIFVVAGRRRVIHARLANERLRKMKSDSLVKMQCIPDGYDPLANLVIENEYRKDDGPLAKARKADRMRARGDDDETIARAFGVQGQTVRTWWNLLGAPPEMLKEVEAGIVSAAAAIEVGKQAPAVQPAAVAAVRAAGGKGGKALDAVRQVAKGKEAPSTTSTKLTMGKLRKFEELLAPTKEEPFEKGDEGLEFAWCVIRFVLEGSPTYLKDYGEVYELAKSVAKPKKNKKAAP